MNFVLSYIVSLCGLSLILIDHYNNRLGFGHTFPSHLAIFTIPTINSSNEITITLKVKDYLAQCSFIIYEGVHKINCFCPKALIKNFELNEIDLGGTLFKSSVKTTATTTVCFWGLVQVTETTLILLLMVSSWDESHRYSNCITVLSNRVTSIASIIILT